MTRSIDAPGRPPEQRHVEHAPVVGQHVATPWMPRRAPAVVTHALRADLARPRASSFEPLRGGDVERVVVEWPRDDHAVVRWRQRSEQRVRGDVPDRILMCPHGDARHGRPCDSTAANVCESTLAERAAGSW